MMSRMRTPWNHNLNGLIWIVLLTAGMAAAQANKPVFLSTYAEHDVSLSADPTSEFWRAARTVSMKVDMNGRPISDYRTEVRSRWTKDSIYFLFVCPFQQLYLKPDPDTSRETYELWNWNVAEVFIGTDFKNIRRYKEFEISPQGEWIDLDIDLAKPHHEEGWVWNSGFEHLARIDQSKKIWYAVVRIPFSALDIKTPANGTTFRVNLFRTEGGPDQVKEVLWQPTMSKTFHVPERFGLLKLEGK
jgi:hypothetical protein